MKIFCITLVYILYIVFYLLFSDVIAYSPFSTLVHVLVYIIAPSVFLPIPKLIYLYELFRCFFCISLASRKDWHVSLNVSLNPCICNFLQLYVNQYLYRVSTRTSTFCSNKHFMQTRVKCRAYINVCSAQKMCQRCLLRNCISVSTTYSQIEQK